MTANEAVALLIERFPILSERVDDPSELLEMPHVSFGLLASEVLANKEDARLFNAVSKFIDELASSGDDLLVEFLVIDVLEGIAQAPDISRRMKQRVGAKAASMLERVDREYYLRGK